MYRLDDTIVAVSSAAGGQRTLVRLSGPQSFSVCRQIFSPPVGEMRPGVCRGTVGIEAGVELDAVLYLFAAPQSYTGDDLAEIHVYGNAAVTESLVSDVLGKPLRAAGPGEFTARAYLNGKIDLSQAEAVNEIVAGSNEYQLAAAERLLAGRLSETAEQACSSMIETLSLLEAGLDFSQEDIEFISRQQAVKRLSAVQTTLEQLLTGSIRCESVIELPSVGIAGTPNAGKSSLANRLLGRRRSIVSEQAKTTRDVLSGRMNLAHCQCVLFDCAGLLVETEMVLDRLAQQAASEALRSASLVLFCIDVSRQQWAEDRAVRNLIKTKAIFGLANKCDLLSADELEERLDELSSLFGMEFLAVSAKTCEGIEMLRVRIDRELIERGCGPASKWGRVWDGPQPIGPTLTARHKKAVAEAIANIEQGRRELKAGNDEVTAMLLRAAHRQISNLEQADVEDRVLDKIFSRFCVGK